MLITNAKLVTWGSPNQIIEDQGLLIAGGRIKEIGLCSELVEKFPNEKQVNARSQYVFPGNICAHTHFYGAYARGLYIPGHPPKDFPDILEKLWWPLDKTLDEKGIYYSAMVCLIDAIKHGTTILFDHHASPNFINGSLDVIAQAVLDTGLRASLCYEVTDRNGDRGANEGIQENLRFVERVKTLPSDQLHGMVGLHASLTLSEETLVKCREQTPPGIGFHIHVAEHEVDEYDSLQKTGVRVVDRLNRHNMLGDNSIVVHAVHIDAVEMRLLADTGTWVSHQPRSNMNNAVGLPRIEDMLRMGIPVCIGNDGFSNAMWEEWKATYLAHKLFTRDPRRLNGNDLVKMAVYNNARLANRFFTGGPYGVIEPGAAADLMFVDYHPYTPITVDNLPWHILFGFQESMISSTIVAGEMLMEDRRIVKIDEEEIFRKALLHAPSVWRRYWEQFT